MGALFAMGRVLHVSAWVHCLQRDNDFVTLVRCLRYGTTSSLCECIVCDGTTSSSRGCVVVGDDKVLVVIVNDEECSCC